MFQWKEIVDMRRKPTSLVLICIILFLCSFLSSVGSFQQTTTLHQICFRSLLVPRESRRNDALDPFEQMKTSRGPIFPQSSSGNKKLPKHDSDKETANNSSAISIEAEENMEEVKKAVDDVDEVITRFEAELLNTLPFALHVNFAKFFRNFMILFCVILPAAFSTMSLVATFKHSLTDENLAFLKQYSSLICALLSLLPTIYYALWDRRIISSPAVSNLLEWYILQQMDKSKRVLRDEEAGNMEVILKGLANKEDVDDIMRRLALWRLIARIDAEAMATEVSQLHAAQTISESEIAVASSTHALMFSSIPTAAQEEQSKQAEDRQKNSNVVTAVKRILDSSKQRGETREETLRQLKEIQSKIEKKSKSEGS